MHTKTNGLSQYERYSGDPKDQCCARVSPGNREPDPWEKIHLNRTRNRQKIKVSSGTATAKRCVSVLKPEKALKSQHPPHEINEFFWRVYWA